MDGLTGGSIQCSKALNPRQSRFSGYGMDGLTSSGHDLEPQSLEILKFWMPLWQESDSAAPDLQLWMDGLLVGNLAVLCASTSTDTFNVLWQLLYIACALTCTPAPWAPRGYWCCSCACSCGDVASGTKVRCDAI